MIRCKSYELQPVAVPTPVPNRKKGIEAIKTKVVITKYPGPWCAHVVTYPHFLILSSAIEACP